MKKYKDVIFAVILVIIAVACTIPLFINRHIPLEPKSDIWKKFKECEVDKHYLEMKYDINYTKEVEAMNGKKISLDGFIIPLEASNKFSHFLLSVRTSSCQFCPPGSENEIVEVFSKTPISWSDGLVTINGILKLAEQKNETGIFFQLLDANIGEVETNDSVMKETKISLQNFSEYNFTEYNPKTNSLGQNANTKNWVGDKSVILFWRSDCAPCLEEIKLLPKIASKNPNIAFRLIALDKAEKISSYIKTIAKNTYFYTSDYDNREILKSFGNDRVIALPYSILLDKNGNICGKHYGILSPIKVKEWEGC